MTRIVVCAAAALLMVSAPLAPALAIIHNSPALSKNTGPQCREGYHMKGSGHGAGFHQECVKNGS